MLAASEPKRKAPQRKATPAALMHDGDPEQGSDVRIAEVIAQAVSEVPGVAALSPGHLATAATYGAGQTVHGVVLRHRARGAFVVEVHVVADEAELGSMLASRRANPGAPGVEPTAVLPALAEQVRSRVARAMRDMAMHAPAAVDVYFDDLV